MALDNVDLPEILIDDTFLFGITFSFHFEFLSIFSLGKYTILIADSRTILCCWNEM